MDLEIGLAGAVAALIVIALTEWSRARVGRQAAADKRPAGLREASRTRSIRDALLKSRTALTRRLATVLRSTGEERLERIEEALLGADVGVDTTRALIAQIRPVLGSMDTEGAMRSTLCRAALALMPVAQTVVPENQGPHVILVLGVNGVGKTTTIGKLAARFSGSGKRVLLVAADTFRAAAAEQLAKWAERTAAEVVLPGAGGTPAAVVFDGLRAARSRESDVVLIDTAGRLHTSKPLVEELRKIRRVIAEAVPGAPHETLLVLDATTGQNAISQAKAFLEAVDVSGVILTKLDGTAKGGIALAIGHLLELPIVEVGLGEGVEDLRPFGREAFIEGLLGDGEPCALQP